MKQLLLLITLLVTLSGCSESEPPTKTSTTAPTPWAPELEGILVTSSAPVVMANLREKDAYLYFMTMDCDTCWELLVQAEKIREEINIIAVVMSTDNFAVYDKARSHFLMLLPVYADHDENIAYDYDAESSPLWISVEKGVITQRSPTPPDAVTQKLQ